MFQRLMSVHEEIIEVILSEPQTAVLTSRQQIILEMAGKGGGKSQTIGYRSGMLINDIPKAKGFIGANTNMQLSQSTLDRVFKVWRDVWGFTEYDAKANRSGAFVVDKKPPAHFMRNAHFREYSGIISFFNGAIVFLGSLENYMAHDGKEFAWACLDETKDTDEKALTEVILGRLRQYGLWYDESGDILFNDEISATDAAANGWKAWNPLTIHTAPALMGVKWLNEMFSLYDYEKEIKKRVYREEKDYFYKEFDNKAVCIYSTHHNAHNLPPNYIENQKLNLVTEDNIAKHVYGYPFSRSGGEWTPYFSRTKHVKSVPYLPGEMVSTSWDFNVIPYMTCLCGQIQEVTKYMDERGVKHLDSQPGRKAIDVTIFRIYREYCFADPRNSIEQIGEQFAADHNPEETAVYYYGDAQGNNRIEGMGSVTRFKLIEQALFIFLHNDSKQAGKQNINPLKRRDLLNKIFKGSLPQIEIEIDESCTELIDDLELVKIGPKGKFKPRKKNEATGQKEEEHGHAGDALEYWICEVCKNLID